MADSTDGVIILCPGAWELILSRDGVPVWKQTLIILFEIILCEIYAISEQSTETFPRSASRQGSPG